MSDHLDHQFAKRVILSSKDSEVVENQINNLLSAHGIPSAEVVYFNFDVDVPIPLIYEFKHVVRLNLGVFEIFGDIQGEAYDRTYNVEIKFRFYNDDYQDGRLELLALKWPEITGERGKMKWYQAWEQAKAAGFALMDEHARRTLIQQMFEDVFREDLGKMIIRCAGKIN